MVSASSDDLPHLARLRRALVVLDIYHRIAWSRSGVDSKAWAFPGRLSKVVAANPASAGEAEGSGIIAE